MMQKSETFLTANRREFTPGNAALRSGIIDFAVPATNPVTAGLELLFNSPWILVDSPCLSSLCFFMKNRCIDFRRILYIVNLGIKRYAVKSGNEDDENAYINLKLV